MATATKRFYHLETKTKYNTGDEFKGSAKEKSRLQSLGFLTKAK